MSAQTRASHHRLAPMFEPRLIALVGASQREGSVGRMMVDVLRGRPGADRNALATALSRFSVVAAALGDVILEMDVNPVIACPDSVAAVDALIVASD